jgi:molybdopterin converting factor subunit 1
VRVRLRFFATLRERVGTSEATREVSGVTTVGALWRELCREHPALGAYGGRVAFAVNQQYVDTDHPLQDNDEVAFLPPVSGGSPTDV